MDYKQEQAVREIAAKAVKEVVDTFGVNERFASKLVSHFTARPAKGDHEVEISAGLNEELDPFVHVHWNYEQLQLNTEKGAAFGIQLLIASISASYNATAMKVLIEAGISHETATILLSRIRKEMKVESIVVEL